MLELTSDGRPVWLSPGTSTQLELNSPLFDEDVIRGSYAYSLNVPAGPNGPLYKFPERLDTDQPPGAEMPGELLLEGQPLLVGTQRVRTASSKKYQVSLSGTLGGLASSLSGRAIHSFSYGGPRAMPPGQPYGGAEAGGLLQVPGWLLHANEVVREPESYDYLFAPVRVDNFYEKAPAPADPPVGYPTPPAVLNPWVANTPVGNTYGLPAGGSFASAAYLGHQLIFFTLPNIFDPNAVTSYRSDSGQLTPVFGQFACPFPRLRYVLRCIFEESGQSVDEGRFLPGELAELVIVSPANTIRAFRDEAGVVQSGFHLADSLPDITVAQLLQSLRQSLGIIVDVDPRDRRVYTRYLHEQVATPAAEADDWTDKVAGAPEVEIDVATVLKMVYETDPEDELTKDLEKGAPDPATLGPEVDTLADLPLESVLGLPEQTRLVRDQAAYFRSRSSWAGVGTVANLTWSYLAPDLAGVEVGGPDGEEVAQGIALTLMGRVPVQIDPANNIMLDPNATEYAEVPHMSRPGYDPADTGRNATARPAALRLLFWRGMQPASDGSLYPLLTPLNTNQGGQLVGNLSLRLGGPAGTYNQLLRGWLEVKRRNVVVKQPLRLTTLDLARLDLTRKVRLDGVEYFVRRLSATVPLRKTVGAELIRVN